jgi:hypothetical protein
MAGRPLTKKPKQKGSGIFSEPFLFLGENSILDFSIN